MSLRRRLRRAQTRPACGAGTLPSVSARASSIMDEPSAACRSARHRPAWQPDRQGRRRGTEPHRVEPRDPAASDPIASRWPARGRIVVVEVPRELVDRYSERIEQAGKETPRAASLKREPDDIPAAKFLNHVQGLTAANVCAARILDALLRAVRHRLESLSGLRRNECPPCVGIRILSLGWMEKQRSCDHFLARSGSGAVGSGAPGWHLKVPTLQ